MSVRSTPREEVAWLREIAEHIVTAGPKAINIETTMAILESAQRMANQCYIAEQCAMRLQAVADAARMLAQWDGAIALDNDTALTRFMSLRDALAALDASDSD